jgi:Holliday junction resolvase RusA-like endonuclease
MPRPPSTNKLWARGAKGQRIQSNEYAEWLTKAGWIVKMQIVGLAPIDCRFDLVIEVPISRRDTGNWEKPICDLCEHVGVVTNDGNARNITIMPVERDDCMAAFWPLPDMGGIRKTAKPRRIRKVWKKAKKGLSWIQPNG